MRAQLSFVLSQITRLPDRRTDRQTEFSSLDRVCIPCSAVKTGVCCKLCQQTSPVFFAVDDLVRGRLQT